MDQLYRKFDMSPQQDTAKAFMPYPATAVLHATQGPLSGLTFGVKDLYDVAGYPTSGGQPFLLALSGIKQRHAKVVQQLLDSGAKFAGKTVTDELAFSMNGQNAHFGNPINGAAPERITGGSSSGSAAAVSNGLCDFALGTDTGGSVRAPANHCGLIGLRPTHGRISLEGTLDLAPSLDTCGWFSKDMPTFERVADVLLGQDVAPLPASIRLLKLDELWGLVSGDVAKALEPACRSVQEQAGSPHSVQGFLGDLDAMYWHFRYIQGREAWLTDGPMIEKYNPPLGPGVKERFAWSKAVTDAQFEQALSFRQSLRQRVAHLLGTDGVVMLPTMPDCAPLIAQDEASLEDYRNRAIRLLCLAGLCGFPQISLPLAHSQGAPLGLSLLGPAGSDRSLVRLAARIMA
jgi:amidase